MSARAGARAIAEHGAVTPIKQRDLLCDNLLLNKDVYDSRVTDPVSDQVNRVP